MTSQLQKHHAPTAQSSETCPASNALKPYPKSFEFTFQYLSSFWMLPVFISAPFLTVCLHREHRKAPEHSL